MILAQLLRRPGRPAEYFLAVLLATTSVTVLAGAAAESSAVNQSGPLSEVETAAPVIHVVLAVDRASATLLVVTLVVCGLFLANAAATAVRERRRELAVLACLGWPARSLAVLCLGEVCLVGFLAGAAGAGLATPLGQLLGVERARPWFAVPVALALCLAAAAVPALRASRAHPVTLTGRSVQAGRGRAGRPRHVVGLATANLGRRPGGTGLGAACLAGGVVGLALAAAVFGALHASVTTSLGDPLPVRVRNADLVLVLATVTISAVAVADVLLANTHDRAAELATLRATGWSDAALIRLVAYEGLGIGVIGTGAGAAAGLWGTATLVGGFSGLLALTAVASAFAGLVVAGLAAVGPVLRQPGRPMSELLAEE